ncbi:hypothetical protein K3757_16445 [Sulfitobacter sp. S223]|uniref:hypothetical protein n=1 Tax=Sulfitobacter sp. S223 TaxID=2867023 RepID=UPI0021A41496|nr:hypothetical protein [Sulfitobacter sp. S223]UWR26019.1 hypothetical protein K3757_16445 [Sulfitobacter sp. S223]
MLHFAFAIYSIAFSVTSGAIAVAIIMAGFFSFPTMIGALIAGALISLPLSYFILKQMDWSEPDKRHAARPDRWYIR